MRQLRNQSVAVWEKPTSSPAVSRAIARRYKPAPDDPSFLSAHLTPESLVIQASCSSRLGQGFFLTAQAGRESKKQGQTAKKIFSSGSMALKSVNLSYEQIHSRFTGFCSIPHAPTARECEVRSQGADYRRRECGPAGHPGWLPLRQDLLSQAQGQVLHPNLQSLHLHA